MTSLLVPSSGVAPGIGPSYSNLLGWTSDLGVQASQTANYGSQVMVAEPIYVPFTGLAQIGVLFELVTSGVAVTASGFGIYQVNPATPTVASLIAQTVDQSANMNNVPGSYQALWVSNFNCPASNNVLPTLWLAYFNVFTTTAPVLRASSNITTSPGFFFKGTNAFRSQLVSAAALSLPASFNPQASVTPRIPIAAGIA